MILTAGRSSVRNLPLRSLLRYAYRVRDYQLIDLPNWGASVPFDVEAKYPGGSTPPNAQVRAMLRRLLAERFGLVAHEEVRPRPTYDLVRAKQTGELGPDIKPAAVDCSGQTPRIGTPASGPVCTMLVTRAFLRGGAWTMEQLATTLETYVQAPVLDRAALSAALLLLACLAAGVRLAGGSRIAATPSVSSSPVRSTSTCTACRTTDSAPSTRSMWHGRRGRAACAQSS